MKTKKIIKNKSKQKLHYAVFVLRNMYLSGIVGDYP